MGCSSVHRWFVVVVLILSSMVMVARTQDAYGKGFFNHTGCLYSYLEGGFLQMHTADEIIVQEEFDTESLTYDPIKSKCTNENEPGKIVFTFKTEDRDRIKSATISMKIVPSLSEGYWEIGQANITIARADIDRKKTFPLRVSEMYASLRHSYSCKDLMLESYQKKKPANETGRNEPRVQISLKRFQLQPFSESEDTVFNPSFDCAVWITIPGLMGLILIAFMTVVAMIGINLLSNIDTNDFKNNKEGQLFTQSQMESNKLQ